MKQIPAIEILLFIIIILLGYLAYLDYTPSQCVQKDLFFEVSERFADIRNYTNGTYDCNNYSMEFNQVMQLLGYETYIYHNYTTNHAYNLVAIEPQQGRLFKHGFKQN